MAYSSGQLIIDDDYNIFATGNAAGTGDNNVANLNTVWSTGTSDKGWGQASPITAVSTGSVITATQWTTLLNRMTAEANHTGTSITAISNPAAGDTITAYSALSTNITNIFNGRNNAAAVGSTITANGVATRSTAWAVSLAATHTITFSSADAARYFFNAGGRITWAGARSGGSVNDKNTSWTNLLTACGTINWTTGTSTQTIAGTAYTGTTKIGGSGSATVNTGYGYYDFTTTPTQVFQQFSSAYLYTVNYVQILASLSGAVITLTVNFVDAENQPEENVDGTLTSTVTLVQPSTSFISNTWGTPTIASSITGS
jgi:hypothetical protein